MTKLLLFLFSGFVMMNLFGGPDETAAPSATSQIGAHSPFIIFEKNENPQNLLVAYVKLDKNCAIQMDPDQPNKVLVDFYWLMNGKTYKPVHPLIKQAIRSRTQTHAGTDNHKLEIELQDLKEIKQDLKDPKIQVTSFKKSGKCQAQAEIELGPSDQNEKLVLNRIVSVSKKKLLPPFREIESVTLKGYVEGSAKQDKTRLYSAQTTL